MSNQLVSCAHTLLLKYSNINPNKYQPLSSMQNIVLTLEDVCFSCFVYVCLFLIKQEHNDFNNNTLIVVMVLTVL